MDKSKSFIASSGSERSDYKEPQDPMEEFFTDQSEKSEDFLARLRSQIDLNTSDTKQPNPSVKSVEDEDNVIFNQGRAVGRLGNNGVFAQSPRKIIDSVESERELEDRVEEMLSNVPARIWNTDLHAEISIEGDTQKPKSPLVMDEFPTLYSNTSPTPDYSFGERSVELKVSIDTPRYDTSKALSADDSYDMSEIMKNVEIPEDRLKLSEDDSETMSGGENPSDNIIVGEVGSETGIAPTFPLGSVASLILYYKDQAMSVPELAEKFDRTEEYIVAVLSGND